MNENTQEEWEMTNMKSTKDKDKNLGKNEERKPQRRRQRLEEQWKNKILEPKK